MGTITGGIVAFVAGIVLAGATAFGIVQAQTHAATQPIESSTVSYGTN